MVRTAGKPAYLKLIPDRSRIDADGEDLCYILVEAYDKKGILCPHADHLVRFTIDGPADIAGVGNGNPQSTESFLADYRHLFFGKAMLIVRSVEGVEGRIKIVAKSDGLKEAKTSVVSQ